MTKIHTVKFQPESIATLRDADHTRDWPVVYLLENGREAYVGETVSAFSRFKQHYENPRRRELRRAHLMIDSDYNKSATLDTESWLIQYMVADGVFSLQNGNGGLANHSYYDREKYRAKFEILWKELQSKGLAKRDLIQLRNTDIFKYSPYKALTNEQTLIVESIKADYINGVFKTYIINGDPGTGKSVLATYIVKNLVESSDIDSLKIGLVVPMTSLRSTLKKVFSQIKGLSSKMVMGPNDVVGQDFDILIADEAHRLRRRKNLTGYGPFDQANKYYGLGNEGTQLDWILNASKTQVLMFDEKQSITPGDIPSSRIADLPAKKFHLTSQLRVLAGDDYIKFIDDLLNVKPVQSHDFGEYDLKLFNSAKELIDAIKRKDAEHGLARTVAGYAWDWKTKKAGEGYDIELDGLKLVWNSTNTDWVNSSNAINEIGCIHTIQGYDLNYVGVIIGPELSYDPVARKMIIDKDKYKDKSGKTSLDSPEELDRYIINIYKTLLTRGIKGTYIHAVDPALNDYIAQRLGALFTKQLL